MDIYVVVATLNDYDYITDSHHETKENFGVFIDAYEARDFLKEFFENTNEDVVRVELEQLEANKKQTQGFAYNVIYEIGYENGNVVERDMMYDIPRTWSSSPDVVADVIRENIYKEQLASKVAKYMNHYHLFDSSNENLQDEAKCRKYIANSPVFVISSLLDLIYELTLDRGVNI